MQSTAPGAEFEPAQVLAFRLAAHRLATRLPAGSLLEAAAVCGVQNTPPGAAALALQARMAGLRPGDVERALVEDKTLLQAWSLRASPHVFPTSDAAVYGRGLLPPDEVSLRHFLGGAQPALDHIGISATRAVELAGEALARALDGRALTKDRLGVELAERVAAHLSPPQLAAWRLPSWYAPGQSLGESVMRFVLPVLALGVRCCHAERRGKDALLVRTEQWLGAPLPAGSLEAARAELVRRYLHAYGPSTVEHLAEWAGIAPAQAGEAWRLVEDELAEVAHNGRPAWLLAGDRAALASPPAATGVRFLPAHDPYLQMRDRATLIPDPALGCRVWRRASSPGVVLCDGQIAATWRSRKQGKKLVLSLAPAGALPAGARTEIETEAWGLGSFCGCETVQVLLVELDS